MKVLLPTPLLSYTANLREVEATGPTIAALLADLDRRYPGIRFRIIDEQGGIRPHIRIFVNGDQIRHLDMPLRPPDEVQILQALSGGRRAGAVAAAGRAGIPRKLSVDSPGSRDSLEGQSGLIWGILQPL